jgi:hypothetical protein
MVLNFRKFGSEYLNIVFGWKPLTSDVRKLNAALQKTDRLLKQYQRDSGRQIRRGYDFPVEKTTTVTEMGTGVVTPTTSTTLWNSFQGPKRRIRVVETRMWFRGSFTYYLNPGKSFLGNVARREQIANKLFGIRLSPEVLWELTPWSWLVDPPTNMGEVMTNISALTRDNLVMRYGYIMCEQRITDTYTLDGIVSKSYGPVGTISQSFTTIVKQRLKATPYGFGLDPAAFTAQQWAILVALGLTKSNKVL